MFGTSTRLDSCLYRQVLLIRAFASISLLFWLGRWWLRLGLHQLQNPPFINPRADNFYWLLHYLNIPQTLLGHYSVALSFDLLLLLLPILIIIYPFWRLWAWFYAVLTVLYLVAYNSSATHHEHTLVGIVFVSFLLCFKSVYQFERMFRALRYYTCFMMLSAAVWKIGRGALWHPEQMQHILMAQHSEYLILYPEQLFSRWIDFLMENHIIADMLWWGATLLELFFLVGFFTRKLDGYLFIAFWLFLLCDYFVMGLHFWELGILSLVFLPYFRRC